MMSEAALPEEMLLSQTGAERAGETAEETAGETTPGHDQEVRWEVVAVARGLAEAAILQGRLESEGIPTQVQQETIGVIYGLTVGPLGQAKVLVPEPLVERALEILNERATDVAGNEQENVQP